VGLDLGGRVTGSGMTGGNANDLTTMGGIEPLS